jgi:hypothetical protein
MDDEFDLSMFKGNATKLKLSLSSGSSSSSSSSPSTSATHDKAMLVDDVVVLSVAEPTPIVVQNSLSSAADPQGVVAARQLPPPTPLLLSSFDDDGFATVSSKKENEIATTSISNNSTTTAPRKTSIQRNDSPTWPSSFAKSFCGGGNYNNSNIDAETKELFERISAMMENNKTLIAFPHRNTNGKPASAATTKQTQNTNTNNSNKKQQQQGKHSATRVNAADIVRFRFNTPSPSDIVLEARRKGKKK